MIEIAAKEQGKEKRMKRIEDNLRDLWDNIKCIQIIGVPEEEKKKGYEKIFEEIIVENFLNMEKEIATQIQEASFICKLFDDDQCETVLHHSFDFCSGILSFLREGGNARSPFVVLTGHIKVLGS